MARMGPQYVAYGHGLIKWWGVVSGCGRSDTHTHTHTHTCTRDDDDAETALAYTAYADGGFHDRRVRGVEDIRRRTRSHRR